MIIGMIIGLPQVVRLCQSEIHRLLVGSDDGSGGMLGRRGSVVLKVDTKLKFSLLLHLETSLHMNAVCAGEMC